ncbi:MAG: class I SAM-dependent methyltransferase [Caulobacterales bacterium]|uniref:class I SAM-dependent methyltransferase n=1 Tax=Glycocaulis sp. TaxID=1969725 RepID=UPI003FA0A92A
MRLLVTVSALAFCLPLMACGDASEPAIPASEEAPAQEAQAGDADAQAGDATGGAETTTEEEAGEPAQAEAEGAQGEETAAALSTAPETGSLAWAVSGEWRADAIARDVWRNPRETLEFFEIDPSGTIVEIWPAGGWYTQVLAPWIAANGGTYVAAHFDPAGNAQTQAFIDSYVERFSAPLFGEIQIAAFGPETGPIVPEGSADAVLTFRNVHNWMSRGFEEKAFADFYAALRPGGILGVVEHRLPASQPQDPRAGSGYVQEDYVIALATEAGFELVASSEINANPADTADHPFGVWTLPPVSRTSPVGGEPDPEFDSAPYESIGESDRMTLLFRKPGGSQSE